MTHCYFFQVVVSEDKSRRMGSACHLTAKCSHCSGVLGQTMTSQKTGLAHTGHDINRRIISAAAVTGIGFTQLSRFFALLNMPPPMHQKTWQFYQKTLYTGAHQAADSHLQEAAELVREMYAEMKIGEPTPDGQLDVSVSFDGNLVCQACNSPEHLQHSCKLCAAKVSDLCIMSQPFSAVHW